MFNTKTRHSKETISEQKKQKNIQTEAQREKRKNRTELSINEYKTKISYRTWANVCVTGISEEEKRDRENI